MFFRLSPTEVETLIGFLGEILATQRNDDITAIYERLLEENVACSECGERIDRNIALEELGFCVSCSNDYFDSKEDK